MYGLLLHNHGAHVVATASLSSKGIRLEVSATTSLTTDSGACNYLFTNFLCINCGVAEWLSEIGKCGTPSVWHTDGLSSVPDQGMHGVLGTKSCYPTLETEYSPGSRELRECTILV